MEVTEKRRITSIEDLSNDITIEILLLLPLNSIIQCYDVCKRWRSLISGSPFFLTQTVNVATIALHEFMCLKKGQSQMQSSELDFSVGFPTRQYYHDMHHISSCNGLLFSCHFMSGRANLGECYISNPWTKECVRLPNPSMLCSDSLFGLAFENNSSNINSNNNVALYKVVMAYRVPPFLTGEALYEFEIYSSKKRRWGRLGRASRLHLCWPGLDENAVYSNRVLYWQCRCRKHALMFNMDTKTSDYLDLPQKHDTYGLTGSILKECDGQLHCIQIFYDCLRLYVLKKSTTSSAEWLMLHNADLKRALERDLGTFPLSIGKILFVSMKPIDMSCQGDDKVLLLENSKLNIVSYDVKKDVFETVNTGYISPHKFFRYTPTKTSISKRQGEISKQFKKLSNYARKLLGRWKSAS